MNEMRRREHGVRGVLGELGGAHIHHEEAFVVALKGRVQRAHDLRRLRVRPSPPRRGPAA